MRTWLHSLLGKLTKKAPRISGRTPCRLVCQALEGRDVPSAPSITLTSPSPIFSGGTVPSWTATVGSTTTVDRVLKVVFDSDDPPTSASAANKSNYELRDMTSSTTVSVQSVSYSTSTKTATITLAAELPVGPDTYRFTVKDAVVAADGSKLDGDANGSAGGNFVRTFSVAPKSLTVTGFPSTATAGQAGSFTVTILDAAGRVATGYRGTVRFTSNDSKATLPAAYTFTASDAGRHTFTATLNNTGTKSITATDTASGVVGKQSNISVKAAAPTGLDPSKPPSGNFNLSTWNLTLPTGAPTIIATPQLRSGYSSEYFDTGADGAMVFWAPVTGSHTSGSSYARSELRETTSDGTLFNWRYTSGSAILAATVAINQVPSTGKVVIGQIHNKTAGEPLIKLMYQYNASTGTGSLVAQIRRTPTSGNTNYTVATGIPLNASFRYQIGVKPDGTLDVLINGVSQYRVVLDPSWATQLMYFKAGSYVQDNSGPSSEGARVSFYALAITHA